MCGCVYLVCVGVVCVLCVLCVLCVSFFCEVHFTEAKHTLSKKKVPGDWDWQDKE